MKAVIMTLYKAHIPIGKVLCRFHADIIIYYLIFISACIFIQYLASLVW